MCQVCYRGQNNKAQQEYTLLCLRERNCFALFLYIFNRLECVGHSFAYVAHFVFLREVWIQTQRAAVASRLVYQLSYQSPYLSTHSPFLATQLPSWPPKSLLGHPNPFLATQIPSWPPISQHFKDKIPIFRNKYSQKRNIGVSVPISTFMRLWVTYIFPRSVCLFCWRKYVDRSWDYINRSQTHECGNWGWGYSQKRNT